MIETDREYIVQTRTCSACGYENDWTCMYCIKCFPHGIFGEWKDPELTFKVKDEKKPS